MTVVETSTPALSERGALPTYRSFEARVTRTQRLCPSFLRITFTGDELHAFGLGGADQRIKLLLPPDGGTLDQVHAAGADWYERWRSLPEAGRPVLRTYTVRSARPELAEVDVDFVLHGVGDDAGAAGPASRWAAAARTGDGVLLVGPDRSGAGRAWGCEWAPPAGAGTLLLAGDETAVPAVCAVLEQLPAGPRTVVLLEVPEAGDVMDVAAPSGAQVRWLPRRTAAGVRPHGQLLTAAVRDAVREAASAPAVVATPWGASPTGDHDDVDVDAAVLWEVPAAPATAAGGLYAWLAGEAGVVKELRRHLVRDVGVPRSSVAFMGYWRAGRPQPV